MQSAHPKIQKMCEEESDDSEAVAKLLEINDSIHRTIERYKLVKKGDVEAASKIPRGTLGTTTGVGKNAANELSLIDFDPEPLPNGGPDGTSHVPAQTTSVEDDLLGLSMDDRPFGQSGGIALGLGANAGIPGPALLSSTTQQTSARPTAPVAPSQLSHTLHSGKPNYDAFSTLSSSRPSSKPATPTPVMQQQRQIAPQPATMVDPFAALVSPSPRAGSPAQPRTASKPTATSSSLLDLGDAPPNVPSGANRELVHDDEWTFTSSLPEQAAPNTTRPMWQHLRVLSSYISIDFLAAREEDGHVIRITAQFSNTTKQNINGLHFQVAVEKVSYSNH